MSSIVSNLIEQISSSASNGINKTQAFDLEDMTFAKLLEKQGLKLQETNSTNSITGQLGMPVGFQIESIDGSDINFDTQDNETNKIDERNQVTDISELDTNPNSIKKSEENFFSSLLNDQTRNTSSEIFNFAIKHAALAYGLNGKSAVNDLKDFVEDIAGRF